MSLKRLAGLVRYLHHLSAQLVARAKGLPEPPHPQDHCRHAWITLKLKAVAKRHAQGRIVSCLEGGYDLSSLSRSVEAHLRVLADV